VRGKSVAYSWFFVVGGWQYFEPVERNAGRLIPALPGKGKAVCVSAMSNEQ
jgi:hypothetical protein